MGVLLAFFVGWSVGAKAGARGFEEVVDAMRTVKDSEEFAALVMVARSHAAAALQEVGKLMSGETALPESADLLERVQRLTGMAR
jgi:hypothetical protein